MKLAVMTGALLVGSAAHADELVTNGDFSAGNSGFSSNYTYNVDAASNPPGSYFIISGDDHTTGTGNYLLADTNGGTTDTYFWSETLNVVAANTYAFSAYVRSNSTTNEPYFVAKVNGVQIASLARVGPDNYVQVTGTYDSGASTSALLQLFNYTKDYSYNDLRVDDVSFSGAAPAAGAVPEPAGWALMIGGVGMVGGVMRRRRGGEMRMAQA